VEIGENISFGADGVGRGVLNHYKHDSKAHPPFVRPRRLAYMHIQLLGVRAKRDDAYASGFKVSLLFGGSSLERELAGISLRANFHEMKTGAEW